MEKYNICSEAERKYTTEWKIWEEELLCNNKIEYTSMQKYNDDVRKYNNTGAIRKVKKNHDD